MIPIYHDVLLLDTKHENMNHRPEILPWVRRTELKLRATCSNQEHVDTGSTISSSKSTYSR